MIESTLPSIVYSIGMQLSTTDLVKFYGEGENRVKVLKGISTGVEKGETVVLEDREAEQYCAFRVDSIVQYSPNFTVFMDIDEIRKLYLNGNMYFVINALLVRKIDRVTPAEVLKNRE